MAKQHLVTILVLCAVSFLEVASRPSNNELPAEKDNFFKATAESEVAAVSTEYSKEQEENTKDILDKIQTFNDQFKKPLRQQTNLNKPNHREDHLEIDEELLAKIQHLVASGKLNAFSDVHKPVVSNYLNDERYQNARALAFAHLQKTNLAKRNEFIALIPAPYMTSYPVVAQNHLISLKSGNDVDLNSIDISNPYQTKQSYFPSFNVPWPLASYFPIIVKDPLLGILHGGGWDNFIEYGQSADVCNKKQKSNDIEKSDDINLSDNSVYNEMLRLPKSRQARSIKKRTVSTKPPSVQKTDDKSKPKKFFSKPLIPVKKPTLELQTERTKTPYDQEPDLRFPFGGDIGGWFFHKKPQVPSPGFFINRLKVRKGGVAIAGPGGVATAGKGGTAIVGPGGLAYTQPGGIAVAGPSARVIALSSGVDLNTVVTRLRAQSAEDGSIPRLIESIPEGKLVATGPVIYYHPAQE